MTEHFITEHLDIWSSVVTTKSASGRGKNSKLALYGIKKLRELILELAVHGLLVPQNRNDEPASVLLKKIKPEKEQILKEGKFKSSNQKSVVDYKQLFTIPESWQWCHLEEIAAIARGGSPRPIASFITDSEDGLNWIKIGDTDRSSRYVTSTEQKITKEGLIKTRMVYPGDLILSNSMSFGFPYILKITGCIHDGWLVIRPPKNLIDKMYLCYLFLSLHAKKSFADAASGAVVQNLNADKVRLLAVPLPPLAEQHRIVAKVDELMALCEQLEQEQETSISAHQTLVHTLLAALTTAGEQGRFDEAWARIAGHFDILFTTENSIDQLKQSILQLAVMGKLVPQNPGDEPASVLLKKIAAEKARLIKEGKMKKQKKLAPIGEDEKPFDLPEGWEWSRIGKASITTDYGLSEKSTAGIDGVPILAMGHIQSGQVLLNKYKVVPASVDGLPDLYLKNRDLLYNRTNSAELVGKTGIYIGDDDKYTFASYLIRIRTDKDSLLPEFININMLSPKFRETQIIPHLKQQCGQANVNGTIMENMLVAVPPSGEMERICAKVDGLMALCDSLKERIKAAQTTQQHLADAMAEQAIG